MWDGLADRTGGAGFFNNTNEVEDTPNKGQKVRRMQNVVPVVVKQLKQCKEDEFTLFGMQTQILCLVGLVLDFEVQTTKAIYNIQDHTGSIKAIWWLDNDKDNNSKMPPITENTYVQIFGSFRVQDNEKMIMVLKMFPISDHLLQVIQVRLAAENMFKNPTGPPSVVRKNNPGAELANSMHFLENSSNNAGFSSVQAQVHDILKRTPSISGISKTELLRQFPQNKTVEVMDALEFLINEGHAYSTIDTEHFKATDPL